MRNWKKSLLLIAMACAIFFLLPSDVSAKGTDQFFYHVRESHVEIRGINKPSKKVVFPEKIEGVKVTSVDFPPYDGIDEIVIPRYVKVINVGYIGEYDKENGGIEKYTVVKENKYFSTKNGMLFDKSGKKLLECPRGKYGKVVVPDGVTEIADYAFAGCTEITQIVLPKSVKKIGDEAFAGCQDLRKINLPSSVKSIGSDAFMHCRYLTSITIPKKVKKLEGTFLGCVRLKEVKFAKGSALTTVGEAAFFNCLKLKEISLPSKVKEIGDFAFLECRSMKSIKLSSSVKSVGYMAFGKLINDADMKIDNRVYNRFSLNLLYEKTDLKGITIYAPKNSYAYKYASERADIGFKARKK